MASSLTMLPPAIVAVRDTIPAPPMCGLPVPGGHCTRHLHHDGDCCLSGEPTAPVLPDDLDETPFRCRDVECPECGGEGRVLVRARGRHDVDDALCPECWGEGRVMP